MQLLTCCKKNNNHPCFKRLALHVLLFDIGYFLLLRSDVQPTKRVTRGPNKYLEIWDLPNDQEIELPLNSVHQPVDEGRELSLISWVRLHGNLICARLNTLTGRPCQKNLKKSVGVL